MILSKDRLGSFYPWAWWLVAVTIPWGIALNNIAFVMLVLVWISHGHVREKWLLLKQSPWVFPFLLLYAVHAMGLIYSNDVFSGLKDLQRKIPILVLPLIATTGSVLQINFICWIKRSFAYSCFTVVIISLVTTAFRLYSEGINTGNLGVAESQYHYLHSTASLIWLHFSYIQIGRWGDLHPTYFSMLLIFSVVILLNEMDDSKKYKILRTSAVVVMIMFIGLLASRMAVLAFVFSSVYLILKNIKIRMVKHVVYFSSTILILLIAIWINPVARFRLLEEPTSTSLFITKNTTKWNSVNYRLLEWKGAWSIIKNNPLLGVGTGDGNHALEEFYSNFNASTVSVQYDAHCQYLQTWVETGIFGLLILLLCLLIPLIKLADNPTDVSFIIIFSSMCLTECIFELQKGVIFFSVFFALILCRKK